MNSPAAPRTRVDATLRLSDPVASSRFVDATRAEALGRLGVSTVGGLVEHLPHRYLDLTKVMPLADVRPGTEATLVGKVHDVTVKRPRPRLTVTEVGLVDGTGVVVGVWFNQPWVASRFHAGDEVAFSGTVELDYGLKRIANPFVERIADKDGRPDSVGRVVPVHSVTEGLSTGWARRLVAAAIDDLGLPLDPIPASLRTRRHLRSYATALRDAHFPETLDDAHAARRRFAYEELLLLQLYMALRRHALTVEREGTAHRVDGPRLAALRAAIPFELTPDQTRATGEVLDDLAAPRPMNRLLLGDVGTGKTIVAAHALAVVADSGSQAAMMAPTEVLAQQYAEKTGPLLDTAGVTWRLLTGSTPRAERASILERLASGDIDVVFGTHALLEERVRFARLTLAIVDEQHRFGVGQRLGLRAKGESVDLLVMTATPIPRSLALTLYGDLATSVLRHRPSNRPGVTTRHVLPHQADAAYAAVRAAVSAGRQAYVVCALVDESDTTRAKAATREARRLKGLVFHDLRVGLLTGRMKAAEKAAVMSAFRAGDIDVLVSTTVIEVGVDVAAATVMIIEDADRFGLAQLHQLRGRVGRGADPGEVWLVCDPRSAEARQRIRTIVECDDGFTLAEKDLELRGAGQILGDRQHGLPDLRVADLLRDIDLVEAARADAFEIVSVDPSLSTPEHGPLGAALRTAYAAAWEWVSSG